MSLNAEIPKAYAALIAGGRVAIRWLTYAATGANANREIGSSRSRPE
jgi:hypothetical protein